MAWGFTQGSKRGLQLGFGCQVISHLFSLPDSSLSLFPHSFRFFYLPLDAAYHSVMGSRATDNNLQTAPVMSTPLTGDDGEANVPSTSLSGGSLEDLLFTSHAVDASGEAGISEVIVSLITQKV